MLDKTEKISIQIDNNEHFSSNLSNLQVNAFNKIKGIINSIIRNDNHKTKDDNVFHDFAYQTRNNVIYIQGSRGAGKTTFLKYIIQHYHTNNSENVEPIAFIDPTTITTQQHILTEIIAKLNFHFLKSSNYGYENNSFREEWHDNLDNVSKGMELLSSQNNNNHDASWFLGKALKDSTSGHQLERKIHDLIDCALKKLNKKALLIAIDDVDTQTDKAYELLETIRCYLTHPKLIILLSGDLELYSHIVREHKYNEIMIEKSKKDFANKENITELVNQLEQQYLIKVLPIPQRVRLEKFIEIESKGNRKVVIDNIKNEKTVKELISEKLSDELGINNRYIDKYTNFILSQPIRTIIQLLSFLSKENKDDTLENQLRNIYIRDIIENKIELNSLQLDNITPNKLGYEIFKLLDKHNDLETGFYCRPDSEYESYNSSKLFLSALSSEVILSNHSNVTFGNAINMMLAIGGTSSIYLNFVKDNLEQNKSTDDYMNYIELGRGDRIKSLVEHFSPICLNPKTNNQKMLASGVFRTPRRIIENFNQNLFSIDRLSSREALKKELEKQISLFDYISIYSVIISSSSNITSKGETKDYTSIYTFISAIAELLCENHNNIRYKLDNLLFSRTYSFPSFIKSIDKGDDDINDNEDGNEESNEGNEDNHSGLNKLISEWLNSIQIDSYGSKNISLLMIGKIWTRIFYSINNISEEAKKGVSKKEDKRDLYLGEVFSRFIWGLCNSFLIEEVRYHNNKYKDDSNIDEELFNRLSKAQNIATSIDNFKDNLKNVIDCFDQYKEKDFKQKLPLSYSIISCPLLLPFLLSEEDFEKYRKEKHSNSQERIRCISKNLVDKNYDFKKLVISRLPIVGFFKNK